LQARAGWAAHTGVVAADLARRGFTGPSSILDAPKRKRADDLFADRARMTEGLGDSWETLRVALKPYPACHFVHAYADAVGRVGVKPGDVEQIICIVAPQIVPVVCEPRATKAHPADGTQARFSLPFAGATAMIGGRQPLEMFGDDARNDRRILQLAERVIYEPDPSMRYPDVFDARIVVRLRDGRTRETGEQINRGHPDRPLSDDDVQMKFAANARKRLDQAEAAKLAGEVWRLERLDTLEQLLALAQIPAT
jgi:2-methylcitrate dehydratase PrpD